MNQGSKSAPNEPEFEAVADPGGAEGAMAPPALQTSHKKDRFHVSWPPTQLLDLMLLKSAPKEPGFVGCIQ